MYCSLSLRFFTTYLSIGATSPWFPLQKSTMAVQKVTNQMSEQLID